MSFIDEHRSRFGVEPICRTLGWCVSSYCARKQRPPSTRHKRDEALVSVIGQVHADNYQAYGARRVWKELGRRGIEVGRCRVERLMRHEVSRARCPSRAGDAPRSPTRRRRGLRISSSGASARTPPIGCGSAT